MPDEDGIVEVSAEVGADLVNAGHGEPVAEPKPVKKAAKRVEG